MVTAPGTATTTRSLRDDDDRLYVRGADGRRIGWHDLRTGETALVDPEPGAAAELQAAVDAYVAARSPLRRRRPLGAAGVPAPRAPLGGVGPGQDPSRPADPARVPEDLHDRLPGQHVTRLLLARADGGAVRRLCVRDPFEPSLRHAHEQVLGQEQVGAVLARLGGGWHVLHSVPAAADGWLDHLLVGPGGLVVLRTAAHPGGTLRVQGDVVRADGRPVPHVRLLGRWTRLAAGLLLDGGPACPARGVVVAVGTRSVRAHGLPVGTEVVRLEDLLGWVRALPTVLSRVEVARLAATASRRGTWPAEADAPAGAAACRRRREDDRAALLHLRARARRAARLRRARRTLLLGGAAAAVAPALLALHPGLLPQAVAAVGLVTG